MQQASKAVLYSGIPNIFNTCNGSHLTSFTTWKIVFNNYYGIRWKIIRWEIQWKVSSVGLCTTMPLKCKIIKNKINNTVPKREKKNKGFLNIST